ncbi:hypothetical protein [Shinella zoogloeoides]|uniref:hypothetical protein n=1 Tax=Shinella zoogloeoides TaxID=352475 RepID=UPI0013C2BE51|nr:hypothetical protein [Shinella zoogloeoides]
MLKKFMVVATLLLPAAAYAEEHNFTITGGQASVPVGLTVQVKTVTVGEDATTVRLLASFDSHVTNSVNMNDDENAYLAWGEGEQERLHLRQIADNRWMRIGNGQTMEGDLVFPGVIPAGVTKVTLVFNPAHDGNDSSAPGVTIPLELAQ